MLLAGVQPPRTHRQIDRAHEQAITRRYSTTREIGGMAFGMATTKVTITLEEEQLEAVRKLVAAGKAATVSAFIKHAVGVALQDVAGWGVMLAEALEQTGGPLTKKERRWADEVLSVGAKRRGRAA